MTSTEKMKRILDYLRSLSWRQTTGLVIGHGTWIALSFHWGMMGLLFGGIFALLTAPKGLYD